MSRARAVLLTAALALTACSDDPGGGGDAPGAAGAPAAVSGSEAEQLLAEAVETTRGAQALDFTLLLEFDGGSALGSSSARIEGAFRTDGSAVDLSTSSSQVDGEIRILVDGDRAFLGGDGPVAEQLPEGASWAELTTRELLDSEVYSDPGDLDFLYLLLGAQDVRDEGEGEAAGVAVRRFSFAVDVDAAADEARADRSEAVAGLLSFTGGTGPVITGRASVDGAGNVRELEVLGVLRPTEEEAEQLDADELSVSYAFALLEVDAEVAVQTPAGADVVPLEDLPGGQQLLGG